MIEFGGDLVLANPDEAEKTLYTKAFNGPVETSGEFLFSGPQEVGIEGGPPEWIYSVLNRNRKIISITVSRENISNVYSINPLEELVSPLPPEPTISDKKGSSSPKIPTRKKKPKKPKGKRVFGHPLLVISASILLAWLLVEYGIPFIQEQWRIMFHTIPH